MLESSKQKYVHNCTRQLIEAIQDLELGISPTNVAGYSQYIRMLLHPGILPNNKVSVYEQEILNILYTELTLLGGDDGNVYGKLE